MKAEEKCKGDDVIDLFTGVVKGLGGIPGLIVNAAGGYDIPSSESNTTKAKESNTTKPVKHTGKQSASELSWMVITDENGTIKNAAFHCN